MGLVFKCEQCDLHTDLTRYAVRNGGHIGRDRVVCRSCGTQHLIAYPNNDDRPASIKAADGPTIGERHPKWSKFSELDVVVKCGGPLDEVPCCHCGEVGTLSRDWNEKRRCPTCRNPGMIEVGRYII